MRTTVLILLAVLAFGVLPAQPTGLAGQHQNRAASLLLTYDFEAAIDELKQAAAQYKKTESWPYYFSCLNQITQAQIELGQLDAAKQTAKEALWQSIETLSRNNDEAAKAAHKLGQVYEAADRYEDAMECHRMAYDIRANLFTLNHPQIAASNIQMAVTARKQGDFKTAKTFLDEAESILTQYYEATHPEIARVLEERGLLLEAEGKPEQARENYRRAIDILQAFPNQGPEALGRAWCRLGRLLPEGQRAEAYQRAYHLFEANESMQGIFAAEAAIELARGALHAGQPALTVQMSRRALQNPKIKPAAIPLLAKSYLLLGEQEKAFAYFQQWVSLAPNELAPEDWVNAIEVAMLNQSAETSLLWSRMYALRTEGLLARSYVAKAYALTGNRERARQIFSKISRSKEPVLVRALVEEAMGRMTLEDGDIAAAIEHFNNGLALMPEQRFLQLRLLAALSGIHTRLAAQDRHTVDNINLATTYFRQFQTHLKALITLPLTPFEVAWLDNNLHQVLGAGVECLYLQQQYVRESFTLEATFNWFEESKMMLLQLHGQQKNTAPAFWKYKNNRLRGQHPYNDVGSDISSAVGQAWSKHESENSQKLRYQMGSAISWAEFKEVLNSLSLSSYHYWISGRYLYVLQLQAETGRLYRSNWEPLEKENRAGLARQLSVQFLFPGLEAGTEAGIKGLALFPAQELSTFPFASLLANGSAESGRAMATYRHLCATSFVADRNTAKQLPGADQPLYLLGSPSSAQQPEPALAVPTSHPSGEQCRSYLEKWLTGHEIIKKVESANEKSSARVLFCTNETAANALFKGEPDKLKARYIVLDEVDETAFGNNMENLLDKVLSQQHFKGTYIEQQRLCHEPGVYTSWLDVVSSGVGLKQKLSYLRAQPGHEVLTTIRTFGAPYELLPSAEPGKIPILWILGGVFGLILTGLWVRR